MLSSGVTAAFKGSEPYSESDIAGFEQQWHVRLPEAYRAFLKRIGACHVFFAGSLRRRGVEFYRLEELFDWYKDYLEQPEDQLFSVVLPVAGDEDAQAIAAFAWEQAAPHNFSLFWHETHPDDWVDEVNAWGTFEDWVIALVATNGGDRDQPELS